MNTKYPSEIDTMGSPPISGRVSVIMPCFNGESFVAAAIESVLAQSYSDIELVIVDDGSTDRSLDIIRRYGDAVRIFTQTNQGPSAARNRSIREATGEYIAYLDADDYWEPHFAESMVAALTNSNAVLAYCGWQNVTPNDKSPPPFVPPDYENEGKRVALLSDAALWPIHATLTRRNALLEIGGFNEDLPVCEDYDLWLRLTFNKPVVRVEQVLSYYRHHKSLNASDKRGRDAEYIRMIKKMFIEQNPALVEDLPAAVLRECIDGGFMRRAYQCYWNRELLSARRIFRTALRERAISLRDLRYALPALLPERLYVTLISQADKH
jgi:glycosyltransferase involved in cell wall biosynthesis